MKLIKSISTILFEQDGLTPEQLAALDANLGIASSAPVTPVKKSDTSQTPAQKKAAADKAAADKKAAVDKEAAAKKVTGGVLTDETKKRAAISNFSSINPSDWVDSPYFAVQMNNLYVKNEALYTKIKNSLLNKGYNFTERYNKIDNIIYFYNKYLNLAEISKKAKTGRTLYWPVVKKIFDTYASPDSNGNIKFFSIATLQKPITVTTTKDGKSSTKTFDTGMEYFLTRLKSANQSDDFSGLEANCFLAVLCALSNSALAELNSAASEFTEYSSVSKPESLILSQLDLVKIKTYYGIFVEGVRKKGGTWEIDEAWAIGAGHIKKSANFDAFMKMVKTASDAKYLDAALEKIKSYTAPSGGYHTPMN